MEKLFEKAMELWGEGTQLVLAMEEASELSVALSHHFRYNMEETMDKLVDGVADMEIMISQLKYMFKGVEFEEKVNYIKIEKLNKLKTLIEQEEKFLTSKSKE